MFSFISLNLKDEKYFSFHSQLDKCVITGIAMGNEDLRNRSLVKEWCYTDFVMVMACVHWCRLCMSTIVSHTGICHCSLFSFYSPLLMWALKTVARDLTCPNRHWSVSSNSIISVTRLIAVQLLWFCISNMHFLLSIAPVGNVMKLFGVCGMSSWWLLVLSLFR